jgi:hypothetical protein
MHFLCSTQPFLPPRIQNEAVFKKAQFEIYYLDETQLFTIDGHERSCFFDQKIMHQIKHKEMEMDNYASLEKIVVAICDLI